MERIDELIERYFEATLSEEEESALKAFLASPEGQAPEYDEVRAVMGYFAVGRSRRFGSFGRLRNRTRRLIAVAASLAILVTLGVNLYNKSNICVSIVDGKRVTDKEVVMNDVDNILADLLSNRTGMEEQLSDFFGK